jgi:hypothetical protein
MQVAVQAQRANLYDFCLNRSTQFAKIFTGTPSLTREVQLFFPYQNLQ